MNRVINWLTIAILVLFTPIFLVLIALFIFSACALLAVLSFLSYLEHKIECAKSRKRRF